MEQFGLALILFAAFWVGCAAGYIAMRLRAQVAYEKGRNESAAEISALTERLNGRDIQFNEARQRADSGAETIARMEIELRTETDRRTVAEARLTLVPKYEAEVEARGQKIAEQQRELTKLHVTVSELTTRLEEIKKTSEDKIAAIQALQNRVAESFQTMSAEALMTNNKAFLDLAGDALTRLQDSARGDLDQRQTLFGQIMEPLKSSLDRVDSRISELEKERATAYAGLQEQVESMMRTQASLQAETSHLASALRTPSSRGRWGEVQLRRVVELAGMLSHCDFVQTRASEEPGAASRPDVIVQLPNFRQIVVDSKISLAAYLEANDAADEETRIAKRRQHAAEVRAHVTQLSAKGYWDQFPQSPEFVVAFLPGEAFFSAALEHDPELLEFGVERRVILATPTTLIALLRAVAWGWKQEMASSNAREIRDLGKALYDRLRGLADNFTEVQRSLSRTTAAFNRTVGAFESNVIPSARRMRELGASTGDEIASPPPVDTTPRSLHLLAEATESNFEAEIEKLDRTEVHATPLAQIEMAPVGARPVQLSASSSVKPLNSVGVIAQPEPSHRPVESQPRVPAPQLHSIAKPATARNNGGTPVPPITKGNTFIAPPPAKPTEPLHKNSILFAPATPTPKAEGPAAPVATVPAERAPKVEAHPVPPAAQPVKVEAPAAPAAIVPAEPAPKVEAQPAPPAIQPVKVEAPVAPVAPQQKPVTPLSTAELPKIPGSNAVAPVNMAAAQEPVVVLRFVPPIQSSVPAAPSPAPAEPLPVG
jgi:DNA recombination protein RmuC